MVSAPQQATVQHADENAGLPGPLRLFRARILTIDARVFLSGVHGPNDFQPGSHRVLFWVYERVGREGIG